MPRICDKCQHFRTERKTVSTTPHGFPLRRINLEYCVSPAVPTDEMKDLFPDLRGVVIDLAREICDREGDGIFVHYEPKTPTAGAAFTQITRQPRTAAAAGGFNG